MNTKVATIQNFINFLRNRQDSFEMYSCWWLELNSCIEDLQSCIGDLQQENGSYALLTVTNNCESLLEEIACL